MTTQPAAEDLREPPPPLQRVYFWGGIGLVLIFVAFIVGLVTGAPKRGYDTHSADGVRFVLSALGLVISGAAVSLRPLHYSGWFFLALGGLFGYGLGFPPPEGTEWLYVPPRDWVAAVPNSWDSLQLLFGLVALAATVALIITFLPRRIALMVLTIGIAFHWSGIYSAVTAPPPQPWLSGLYWQRVSSHYLYPTYLTNAYQFYSPNPGPATEIWVCLEYLDNDVNPDDPDAVKKNKQVEWLYIPRREREGVDPLGLYFYRHLAVTEMFAGYNTMPPNEDEWRMLRNRRVAYRTPGKQEPIPFHPSDERSQYRPPTDHVVRQIIPSYVRHLATQYERPGKVVHSIKLYRTLHRVLQIEQMRTLTDAKTKRSVRTRAFNPILLEPCFMGDYDRHGVLKDPNDGMLYWLLPIMTTPKPAPMDRVVLPSEFREYYTDYVSDHAGSDRFASTAKEKGQ